MLAEFSTQRLSLTAGGIPAMNSVNSAAAQAANDRSVLLGLLALQLGLASRSQVEESLDAWQRDRLQSFDLLLQQKSRWSPEQSAWLAKIVAAVIGQHHNDAVASLA